MASYIDKFMQAVSSDPVENPSVQSKKDPNRTMRAVEWFGDADVRVVDRPKPMITEPGDAIIRMTSATLCGSDLHLYHHEFSGMEKHDVLGHEAMGIVEEVGPDVTGFNKGDRVIVSPVLADGTCSYCKEGKFDACDTTNPSKLMETMIGHRCAGLLGYGHLTGGYEGVFAEYIRVPYADTNLLKITSNVPDDKVLFLADSLVTAWHACELGEVKKDQTICIWGLGPVGLYCAMWAFFRGVKRIIGIDNVPERLQAAAKLGCETINFSEKNVITTVQEMVPGGPDVCVDAVGFRYAKNILHKLERFVRLETDNPTTISECITLVKKGGIVSIIGDYYGLCNHFPIGAVMEKGLTLRSGIVPLQKYWKELLGYVEQGKVDPSFIVTHHFSLEDTPQAYKLFDLKEQGAIKIVIKPPQQQSIS